MRLLEKLLEGALGSGIIECEDCGNRLEPDAEKCHCGWKNPLVEMGMI